MSTSVLNLAVSNFFLMSCNQETTEALPCWSNSVLLSFLEYRYYQRMTAAAPESSPIACTEIDAEFLATYLYGTKRILRPIQDDVSAVHAFRVSEGNWPVGYPRLLVLSVPQCVWPTDISIRCLWISKKIKNDVFVEMHEQ